MRRSLGLALVLVAVAAVPASSGTVLEACVGGDTDRDAVALSPAPGPRVNREAPPGGFYFTPRGGPDDPHTWRETNSVPGLQTTARVCDVNEHDGTRITLLYRYVKFQADTPVEEPEQAVP